MCRFTILLKDTFWLKTPKAQLLNESRLQNIQIGVYCVIDTSIKKWHVLIGAHMMWVLLGFLLVVGGFIVMLLRGNCLDLTHEMAEIVLSALQEHHMDMLGLSSLQL
jgi:hypothetical protein